MRRRLMGGSDIFRTESGLLSWIWSNRAWAIMTANLKLMCLPDDFRLRGDVDSTWRVLDWWLGNWDEEYPSLVHCYLRQVVAHPLPLSHGWSLATRGAHSLNFRIRLHTMTRWVIPTRAQQAVAVHFRGIISVDGTYQSNPKYSHLGRGMLKIKCKLLV